MRLCDCVSERVRMCARVRARVYECMRTRVCINLCMCDICVLCLCERACVQNQQQQKHACVYVSMSARVVAKYTNLRTVMFAIKF
jgi:hypothetical protein